MRTVSPLGNLLARAARPDAGTAGRGGGRRGHGLLVAGAVDARVQLIEDVVLVVAGGGGGGAGGRGLPVGCRLGAAGAGLGGLVGRAWGLGRGGGLADAAFGWVGHCDVVLVLLYVCC